VMRLQSSNAKFLESVYESAKKERASEGGGFGKTGEGHHKFMDIQEFEKEYQERYSQPASSPGKVRYVDGKDGFGNEAESPFLVRENTFEGGSFKTMQLDPSRTKVKHDPFTFHKQQFQTRLFTKP
jgi:hypothetical protein